MFSNSFSLKNGILIQILPTILPKGEIEHDVASVELLVCQRTGVNASILNTYVLVSGNHMRHTSSLVLL